MFTILAFIVMVAIFLFIERRQRYDVDEMETNLLHARQDLRLIAYILMAVLLILGIVADKLH
jgi:hypothetical protein